MQEYLTAAREKMKGHCRVCPICDGRACSGEVPGMGGLGTGASFRNNVNALAARTFNMRLIHDHASCDTSTSVLGLHLSMPVLAAPIGGVSFNMGDTVSEQDYVNAILGGCLAEGVYGSVGDGVPPFIIDSAMAGLKAVQGKGLPFIKPWEGKELEEKLDAALSTGCPALGMDIDAAGLVTLRKMGRPVAPKPQAELERVIRKVHDANVRFVLKGIMTPDDALRALAAGADGIVVSNHGGRVLDSCPGTADVLPAISAAVRGKLAIFVDGGIRTGMDVLKMLALGADAVMIGRPLSIAAMGGLKDGVQACLAKIHAELGQSMLMTGCGDIRDIGPQILFTAK